MNLTIKQLKQMIKEELHYLSEDDESPEKISDTQPAGEETEQETQTDNVETGQEELKKLFYLGVSDFDYMLELMDDIPFFSEGPPHNFTSNLIPGWQIPEPWMQDVPYVMWSNDLDYLKKVQEFMNPKAIEDEGDIVGYETYGVKGLLFSDPYDPFEVNEVPWLMVACKNWKDGWKYGLKFYYKG